MGARQRVERRKRPRVSSSSWKPLSTVPAQPWSSHHPYCRGKVGEYLSFISGPTPASRGADPHPPRDRRPYEAASLHAKLRLLNACSARTYLSSPQPAALLCTSTHRALPPPCCHGDRPGPQQPLIGPTRRVEGADWQGRRPGRAGGLGGGRCGELTRRSPGEGEPGGTWRSAARAEKPRPFLLWLSWRVLWSRIWVGEVLTRDADKNPGSHRTSLGQVLHCVQNGGEGGRSTYKRQALSNSTLKELCCGGASTILKKQRLELTILGTQSGMPVPTMTD
ncbi:uncharacterized protein [Pseudorca crassidens]|uniref:uncharacterized protein isoform X3 n=1 Tax=Pseudorca crassidens TaxID=82174 RepID=UPI00352F2E50